MNEFEVPINCTLENCCLHMHNILPAVISIAVPSKIKWTSCKFKNWNCRRCEVSRVKDAAFWLKLTDLSPSKLMRMTIFQKVCIKEIGQSQKLMFQMHQFNCKEACKESRLDRSKGSYRDNKCCACHCWT